MDDFSTLNITEEASKNFLTELEMRIEIVKKIFPQKSHAQCWHIVRTMIGVKKS